MGGRGGRQEAGAAQLHRPLLTRIPYEEVPHEKPVLPPRAHNPDYHREPVPRDMYVPDHYAAVVGALER